MLGYTRKILIVFFGAICLLSSAAVPVTKAKAESAITIAVVDVEELMRSSNASQSIQKQLIKEKEKLQKAFTTEEDKLKVLEKDIISRKDGMTESEFDVERQKFQKSLMTAKEKVSKQVDSVEKAANIALAELRKEIIKTIAEMADKKKYTIVITKQNVILAEKELDITDEVMKELNRNVKTIKLKM